MQSQIESIKSGLSIAAAWVHLGLRGSCGKECRSPFRDDKRASFSVYRQAGWERWWDHGDASGGDVVDLWAKARDIPLKEAIDDILARFPHLMLDSGAFIKPPNRPVEPVLSPEGIRWPPDIRTPSEAECRDLATLRGLSPEAFFLAGRLGTLKVATVYSQKSWIITDALGRCAEARRFDGAMYPVNGKCVKSFCLPGSKKDMPLGLKTSNLAFDQLDNLLLVEGMPDYFAALQLVIESEINFRPIAVLGAATNIGPRAQEFLCGATVVIIPHNDRSLEGEKAALKWVGQIQAFGARDCFIQRLPIVCNDLNDFLIQRPNDGHQLLKGFHDGISPERPK